MKPEERKTDLVLCQYDPFDNRWKGSNEPLDYENATIEFLSSDLLQNRWKQYHHIRRAKIHTPDGVVPTPLLGLLNCLDTNALKQLEFDRLVLVEKPIPITLEMESLQVLSIDSLEVLSIYPEPTRVITTPPKCSGVKPVHSPLRTGDSITPIDLQLMKACLICQTPNLTSLFLGSNSVQHVKIFWPETISVLEVEYLPYENDPVDRVNLPQYTGLKYLELHRVQNFNLEHVLELARGGQLSQLFVNAFKPLSTDYKPTSQECADLKYVFNALKGELKAGRISDRLEIFMHQVRVVKDHREFHRFFFHRELGEHHFANFCTGLLKPPILAENSTVQLIDEKLLRSLIPHDGLEDRLDQLVAAFPNIQRVVLNTFYEFIQYSPLTDLIRAILVRCKSLTELRLEYLYFLNAAFYQNLNRLESLRTLNTLVMLELAEFERIDFQFVQSFKYLRIFKTNLANKQQAYELLSSMRIDSKYTFIFQASCTALCHELEARRVSSDPEGHLWLQLVWDAKNGGSDFADRMAKCKPVFSNKVLHLDALNDQLFYHADFKGYFDHWNPVTEPANEPTTKPATKPVTKPLYKPVNQPVKISDEARAKICGNRLSGELQELRLGCL